MGGWCLLEQSGEVWWGIIRSCQASQPAGQRAERRRTHGEALLPEHDDEEVERHKLDEQRAPRRPEDVHPASAMGADDHLHVGRHVRGHVGEGLVIVLHRVAACGGGGQRRRGRVSTPVHRTFVIRQAGRRAGGDSTWLNMTSCSPLPRSFSNCSMLASTAPSFVTCTAVKGRRHTGRVARLRCHPGTATAHYTHACTHPTPAVGIVGVARHVEDVLPLDQRRRLGDVHQLPQALMEVGVRQGAAAGEHQLLGIHRIRAGQVLQLFQQQQRVAARLEWQWRQ